MAADNVVVDNSNNIPTSTSGDSTTENGTNSRDENFVIQSDDIDDKLYSSESDSVEQRPDAVGAGAAKLMSATAAAATSLLSLKANYHKALQKQPTKATSVSNFIKLQSDTDTKDNDDPYDDLSPPERDIEDDDFWN